MGNQTSQQQDNCSTKDDLTTKDSDKENFKPAMNRLKTSGTTPNLHYNSLATKHHHHRSMIGGEQFLEKKKSSILATMTSRVLLKEKANQSAQLHSFLSTQNLHSSKLHNPQDSACSSQLYQNDLNSTQPLQIIQNNFQQTLNISKGSPLPQQYLSYVPNISPSDFKQQEYLSQTQYYQFGARTHSKSAHLSANFAQNSTQKTSSQEKENDSRGFSSIQQNLLKKLKNQTSKKTSGFLQPKQQQKKPQSKGMQLPPSQCSSHIKQMSISSKAVQENSYQQALTDQIQEDFQQHRELQHPHHQYNYSNYFQQETAQAFQEEIEIKRNLKFGEAGSIMASEIVIALISYDSNIFSKLLMLSPSWHTSSLQAFDEYCNKIENQFVSIYNDYFYFKQSFTSSQPIKFCGSKGIRIDRVIECELLNYKGLTNSNQTLKIAYQYKLFGDSKTYRAIFQLDAYKKDKARLTWLHQDSINKETYTQPIQQVCIGDSIEFSLNLCNLQGFVESITWEDPTLTVTPKLNVTNYNKDWARKLFNGSSAVKIFCDLNRICEVEDAVVEWYEEAYYQRKKDILDLTFLRDNFDIKEVLYAGVDGTICKIDMIAKREGKVEKCHAGMELIIKKREDELVNEVKRIGYLKDRDVAFQVREGDEVLLYISKSNA